jgi:putative ABC transport system permease protein
MPATEVLKNETLLALLLGFISILMGFLVATEVSCSGDFFLYISIFFFFFISICYLLFIVLVSLIPVVKSLSLTRFLITDNIKPVRFSYSNVKYMLMAQYAVVMLVVIIAFGINKQMNLVKNTQVGGNERNVLVLSQSGTIAEKYAILKSELLKHNEIEAVTACFQLPGDAILDHTLTKTEEDIDGKWLNIMIVGEDFLPFFHIPLIAGEDFSKTKLDYQTEFDIAYDFWLNQKISDYTEEYVVNRKALEMLGFATPEEAIGQILRIEHGGIAYMNQGVIAGVTDDFNYTGLYEATDPLLILQRNLFLHRIMVRLDAKHLQQARDVFDHVWNEIFPDHSADYVFMNELFENKYHNEMNAQYLVFIFSLLCLIIADLGLIIVMAFIIKRRTKEIGLRKVHGATIGEIIRMLNMGFIRYIAVAFIVAVPVAWYIMHRWLERFAYQTSLTWWIFALAGISVLAVSVLSVSLQSWRAAASNPVEAIKIE